jgi:hypothetical protein
MWKPLTMRRQIFRIVLSTVAALLILHVISNAPNGSSPNSDIIKIVMMGGAVFVWGWLLNLYLKEGSEERAYKERMEQHMRQIEEPLIWDKMSEDDREAFKRQYSGDYKFGSGALRNWRQETQQ